MADYFSTTVPPCRSVDGGRSVSLAALNGLGNLHRRTQLGKRMAARRNHRQEAYAEGGLAYAQKLARWAKHGVHDASVRIVDTESVEELPSGQIGETAIARPTVPPGYRYAPEESSHALRIGYVFAGDFGLMDDQTGSLWAADRKKDLINAGGYKIWPRLHRPCQNCLSQESKEIL
ncbi:AMP-binding enzyme [Arthrobacter sp. SLBN-100]|uniref:AMP-binding protein n=1 Tax=Arthrobacter sp. SLBN-100 TaxID=2768450 RepID=UPI00117256D3|nr:AMP-binding protein [Arthrobacter sp. SLBN-100]TQJ62063.1 AMP-binding enzyme [Arthrobacter sp. SLBN-100]